MQRFTNAVRAAVRDKNWYIALTSSLALPDVCGRLVEPDARNSGHRYAAWFGAWMQKHYVRRVGGESQETVFLSGDDCYALRCSFLHEGRGTIAHQRARRVLDAVHFVTPPPGGGMIHNNRFNNALQLQVDVFCLQMADAVDEWAASVANDGEIQAAIRDLLVIQDLRSGPLRI